MRSERKFELARESAASIAAMLARVDDGTATAEDEAVLAEFEDVVRRLSDEDEDPQIKRAILDFARVELDRPGGDELRPRLRVVARGDEA